MVLNFHSPVMFPKFKKCARFLLTSCSTLLIIIICSWQSIELLQIYLSYPTKIQILTSFDLIEDTLASFTLCRNYGNLNGFNSTYVFEIFRKYGIHEEIKFFMDDEEINSNSSYDGLINMTMMISKKYFSYVVKGNVL